MQWIATLPPEHQRTAWGWHALQFTPRVVQVEEALLLEVAASQRLWGGRKRLLQLVLKPNQPLDLVKHAQAATSLIALAQLRLACQGRPPTPVDALPLTTLSAASPHLSILARIGCKTWGQVRSLPRAGVARRFVGLLDALDAAYGDKPDVYPWLTLPDVFDQQHELPGLASSAPELLWVAQRLLDALQVWLAARQRGVLAIELQWTLDLKRHNGVVLPPHQQITVRTAQPTQDMAHLVRLVSEHLNRATLAAPANALRLRTLDTAPWAGASETLLIEDCIQGTSLLELVERLSARLGTENVQVPQPYADHRPERMQRWVPAGHGLGVDALSPVQRAALRANAATTHPYGDLIPSWLLAQPLALSTQDNNPCYGGPLQLLTQAHRIDIVWWDAAWKNNPHSNTLAVHPLAVRDYFIARSPKAGLVWVFCARLSARRLREMPERPQMQACWFLQGVFA